MKGTGLILGEDAELGCVKHSNNLPILSPHDYDRIAECILKKYQLDALSTPQPVKVSALIEFDYGIEYSIGYYDLEGNFCGQMYFVNCYDNVVELQENGYFRKISKPFSRQTMFIDERIFTFMKQRCRFTEAHELSHWILHQKFYTDGYQRAMRSTPKMFFSSTLPEYQANSLASAILLPLQPLKAETKKYFTDNNLVWKQLKDFCQPRNREKYMQYVDHIARTFNVSKECTMIRIERLSGVRYK